MVRRRTCYLPRWCSRHIPLSNPEREQLPAQAVFQEETLSTTPTQTMETGFNWNPLCLMFTMFLNNPDYQDGVDSILSSGKLYLFQFTIAESRIIKPLSTAEGLALRVHNFTQLDFDGSLDHSWLSSKIVCYERFNIYYFKVISTRQDFQRPVVAPMTHLLVRAGTLFRVSVAPCHHQRCLCTRSLQDCPQTRLWGLLHYLACSQS